MILRTAAAYIVVCWCMYVCVCVRVCVCDCSYVRGMIYQFLHGPAVHKAATYWIKLSVSIQYFGVMCNFFRGRGDPGAVCRRWLDTFFPCQKWRTAHTVFARARVCVCVFVWVCRCVFVCVYTHGLGNVEFVFLIDPEMSLTFHKSGSACMKRQQIGIFLLRALAISLNPVANLFDQGRWCTFFRREKLYVIMIFFLKKANFKTKSRVGTSLPAIAVSFCGQRFVSHWLSQHSQVYKQTFTCIESAKQLIVFKPFKSVYSSKVVQLTSLSNFPSCMRHYQTVYCRGKMSPFTIKIIDNWQKPRAKSVISLFKNVSKPLSPSKSHVFVS